MDVFRDLLDNQLVDRQQNKMGRVDGVIAEWQEGQQPQLTYIEVGIPVLARRIVPRLERWVAILQSRWGARLREPMRIPVSKILDVGIDVDVNVDVNETSAIAYEKWLQDNVIGRIPGAE